MPTQSEDELTRREVAERFMKKAKALYPNVGEPGAVYVLEQVLGWTWEKVTHTAVEGFSRHSYRLFVVDEDGHKYYHEDGRVVTVTRKWTNEEKRLLKDWWWLLGL